MLVILMPVAGEGRRFREKGYDLPKPLIDVRGQPMLRRVIENVRPACDHVWMFVGRDEHKLYQHLMTWDLPDNRWFHVGLDGKTDGAARTCLSVDHTIDPEDSLLIVNGDQLVDGGIAPLLETDADAAVLTFDAPPGETKWSYADMSWGGRIRKVHEKPSADEIVFNGLHRATTGHYWFKRAGDFFAAAECMIRLNDRTNGEFYVAPTINYLLAAKKTVAAVSVESYGGVFHGLGTPEDLEKYLEKKRGSEKPAA